MDAGAPMDACDPDVDQFCDWDAKVQTWAGCC